MGSAPCKVEVAAVPDGFRITLTGSFQTGAESLDQELQRIIAQKPKRVELDLAGASFISTTGLAALIAFRNQIVKSGGNLAVTAIHDQTLSIFRFTHLYKLFPLEGGAVVSAAKNATKK